MGLPRTLDNLHDDFLNCCLCCKCTLIEQVPGAAVNTQKVNISSQWACFVVKLAKMSLKCK